MNGRGPKGDTTTTTRLMFMGKTALASENIYRHRYHLTMTLSIFSIHFCHAVTCKPCGANAAMVKMLESNTWLLSLVACCIHHASKKGNPHFLSTKHKVSRPTLLIHSHVSSIKPQYLASSSPFLPFPVTIGLARLFANGFCYVARSWPDLMQVSS